MKGDCDNSVVFADFSDEDGGKIMAICVEIEFLYFCCTWELRFDSSFHVIGNVLQSMYANK